MSVVWEPYIDVPVTGSDTAIAAIEQEMNITLPDDVRDVLLHHPGDAVEPSGIRVGQKSKTTFGAILYVGGLKKHDRYRYSVEKTLVSLAEWSGTGSPGAVRLFPFATNTATGYFCLDFRNTPTNPPVVFVDYNYDFDELPAILPVAPDLTSLLDQLYD